MIALEDLGELPASLQLPANAMARIAAPEGEGHTHWLEIEGRLWLRVNPPTDLDVKKPGGSETACVTFDAGELRFTSDLEDDEEWIWGTEDSKLLRANFLAEILDVLDASVPTLPLWRAPEVLPGNRLTWPGNAPARSPAQMRRVRRDRLTALREWKAGTEQADAGEEIRTPLDRLATRLAEIPRPANAEIRAERLDEGRALGVTWEQEGNFDIIWGAACLALIDGDRQLSIATRTPEEVAARQRLAARVMLVAMASVFEATFGPALMPVYFRFLSVNEGETVDAVLLIRPQDWGYHVAQHVLTVDAPSENARIVYRCPK